MAPKNRCVLTFDVSKRILQEESAERERKRLEDEKKRFEDEKIQEAEMKKQREEVEASILEEYTIWVRYATFARWPRKRITK